MLFALMPLVVPLIEMVFFWELNIPQNISIWDMLLFFLFGGLLSILFSLLIFPSIPEGAIYAPLAEEPGKLLATLAIITYLIKKRKIKIYGITALAVGAAVGAGFSGFESIMYGVKSVVEGEVVGFFFHGSLTYGLTEGMRTIVLRALLAVGGHVQFVAPYAAASAIGGMKGPLSGCKKPGFWIAYSLLGAQMYEGSGSDRNNSSPVFKFNQVADGPLCRQHYLCAGRCGQDRPGG